MKKWAFALCIVFIFPILLLAGIHFLEKMDSEAHSFPDLKSAKTHLFPTSQGEVFGVQIGKKGAPRFLFIHGSPGHLGAWEKVISESDLLEKYEMLFIDRPGYRNSTFAGATLSNQSNALQSTVQAFCRPCTVVGHSYGGALAMQLGVDYPNRINKVISISGTIASIHQYPRWYNRLAMLPVISYLLPQSWVTSNNEMLSLSKDLEILLPKLSDLKIPVAFFQGGADLLVNPASPFELLPFLDNTELFYHPDENHFIPWTNVDLVERILP